MVCNLVLEVSSPKITDGSFTILVCFYSIRVTASRFGFQWNVLYLINLRKKLEIETKPKKLKSSIEMCVYFWEKSCGLKQSVRIAAVSGCRFNTTKNFGSSNKKKLAKKNYTGWDKKDMIFI